MPFSISSQSHCVKSFFFSSESLTSQARCSVVFLVAILSPAVVFPVEPTLARATYAPMLRDQGVLWRPLVTVAAMRCSLSTEDWASDRVLSGGYRLKMIRIYAAPNPA